MRTVRISIERLRIVGAAAFVALVAGVSLFEEADAQGTPMMGAPIPQMMGTGSPMGNIAPPNGGLGMPYGGIPNIGGPGPHNGIVPAMQMAMGGVAPISGMPSPFPGMSTYQNPTAMPRTTHFSSNPYHLSESSLSNAGIPTPDMSSSPVGVGGISSGAGGGGGMGASFAPGGRSQGGMDFPGMNSEPAATFPGAFMPGTSPLSGNLPGAHLRRGAGQVGFMTYPFMLNFSSNGVPIAMGIGGTVGVGAGAYGQQLLPGMVGMASGPNQFLGGPGGFGGGMHALNPYSPPSMYFPGRSLFSNEHSGIAPNLGQNGMAANAGVMGRTVGPGSGVPGFLEINARDMPSVGQSVPSNIGQMTGTQFMGLSDDPQSNVPGAANPQPELPDTQGSIMGEPLPGGGLRMN